MNPLALQREQIHTMQPPTRKKKWIQGAVKHPGALTASARRNGRSKLQEAEVESRSSNPHIRARGVLGKRFIKKDV